MIAGFDSYPACYAKAELRFSALDAFYKKNNQKANSESPNTYIGPDSDELSVQVAVDTKKLLADKWTPTRPTMTLTTERFVCLPSDFDPREKK